MTNIFPLYKKAFAAARTRVEQAAWFNEGWICKTGVWPYIGIPEGDVFKLLKPHWSNDKNDTTGNASGIFFSIWTNDKTPTQIRYNIHAFKLRELRGYKLESRKFAAAFRAAFAPHHNEWPNLRTDFGPQTLMEGFQEITPDTCEETIMKWTARFVSVSHLIDELLLKTKKT